MILPGERYRVWSNDGGCTAESYDMPTLSRHSVSVTVPLEELGPAPQIPGYRNWSITFWTCCRISIIAASGPSLFVSKSSVTAVIAAWMSAVPAAGK